MVTSGEGEIVLAERCFEVSSKPLHGERALHENFIHNAELETEAGLQASASGGRS